MKWLTRTKHKQIQLDGGIFERRMLWENTKKRRFSVQTEYPYNFCIGLLSLPVPNKDNICKSLSIFLLFFFLEKDE